MRRIVAIVLIVIIVTVITCAFLYGTYDPFTNMVNGAIFGYLGPSVVTGASSFNAWLVATLGYTGVYALILGVGAIIGISIHFLWVKADWSLRRWGAQRTAADLAAPQVSLSSSATPANATIRPPAVTPAATPKSEPTPEPSPEESK